VESDWLMIVSFGGREDLKLSTFRDYCQILLLLQPRSCVVTVSVCG